MSYDLAVWEGDSPTSDEMAEETYLHLYGEYIDRDDTVAPTPPIETYVRTLLERWPDITESKDSPWADSPLIRNASGPFIYVAMTYGRADDASAWAAKVAKDQGLVCFDPQQRRLQT